jgi:hypothetical protein
MRGEVALLRAVHEELRVARVLVKKLLTLHLVDKLGYDTTELGELDVLGNDGLARALGTVPACSLSLSCQLSR